MRPPVNSKPTVGHVLQDHIQPTPLSNASRDWCNLTNDNSIQILNLDIDESFYNIGKVSNCLKYVDTISSPTGFRNTNTTTFNAEKLKNGHMIRGDHCKDGYFSKTVISLDSLSNTEGDVFDERIIFSNGECKTSSYNSNNKIKQQDKRNRYHVTGPALNYKENTKERKTDGDYNRTRDWKSDTDLAVIRENTINKNRFHMSSIGNVGRDSGIILNTPLRSNIRAEGREECVLINPIEAKGITSNTADLKQVRLRVKTASIKRSEENISRCTNLLDTKQGFFDSANEFDNDIPHPASRDINHRHVIEDTADDSLLKMPVLKVPRVKVAKLVKCGMRSVLKTNRGNICAKLNSPKWKGTPISSPSRCPDGKRRRIAHIGKLSDFMRLTETRHTFNNAETEQRENANIRINEETNCTNLKDNQSNKSESDTTRYPRLGISKFHTTGRSDLHFNPCHRKLQFGANSPNRSYEFDAAAHVASYITDGDTDGVLTQQPSRRHGPRIGTKGKCCNIVPIDELHFETVNSLKKRIAKVNKSSRIKTNGSLTSKMNGKPIQVYKPISPAGHNLSFMGKSRDGRMLVRKDQTLAEMNWKCVQGDKSLVEDEDLRVKVCLESCV